VAIRALIADDEPAGRSTLRLLLGQDSEVQIVGECRTGADTVDAVLRLRPDLLFLDIQMPGGTGFEVLAELPPEAVPLVVFVTAYDRYSLQAFEVHAADYLLKPFSDRRFRSALTHAKERLRARSAPRGEPLALAAPAADRLAIRTSDGVLMLATAEIDWIEARGDYARIHRGARSDLVRESLSSLEARLGPTRFVRIHRSAIVNLARVREFKPANGGMVAVLADGQRCRLSRRGRERVAGILAVAI
jgi:two-component system LytT family response regulator